MEGDYVVSQHTAVIALDRVSLLFEIVGVVALVMGTLYTLTHFFVGLIRGQRRYTSIDYVRLELGRSITLGLEFFLAGDIIRTIITPDYYQIGILSILVVIRTVLSYFLGKELASLRANGNG